MTTYNLALADYARKTIVAKVGGIDAAIDHLYAAGYEHVEYEEDAENPDHWDIFAATTYKANVYTVEPVKGR